jgi:hypothetical protein
MLIIGCDYHPGFQQIACVDSNGGESERRVAHREQAEQSYAHLARHCTFVKWVSLLGSTSGMAILHQP